jgi:hypothetical protein
MNLKKTALCAAMTVAMGISATASADTVNVSYSGYFTLVDPGGSALQNGDAVTPPMYGWRTPVSGTMTFDTDTGAGSGTVAAFSFAAGGLAAATSITFQAIGDGAGNAGPLILGNMGFNWSGSNGIPVSIVLDASGFFGALQGGLTTSDTISGVGVTAATEGQGFGAKGSYTLPMGAIPIATTTFNTTDIGTVALGTNPSGTLPLTDDGIGGNPMGAGPFPGWNANFDITSLHVDSYIASVVPVPAAVWLFGSGLLGLVGVSRRKKAA